MTRYVNQFQFHHQRRPALRPPLDSEVVLEYCAINLPKPAPVGSVAGRNSISGISSSSFRPASVCWFVCLFHVVVVVRIQMVSPLFSSLSLSLSLSDHPLARCERHYSLLTQPEAADLLYSTFTHPVKAAANSGEREEKHALDESAPATNYSSSLRHQCHPHGCQSLGHTTASQ